MSAIDVVPVSGLVSFLAFCRLPRILYEGQPGFAPPLDAERWTLYAHWLNPHFKEVTSKAWLARKKGKLVGRIAAQIYRPEITPVGASRAQFGSLDTIEDREVVAALTGAAETWLRERGAAMIHGPFSPSVNSETGLLVQGFDAVPMMFMPWHPPYLSRLIQECGYVKARDLISYRYRLAPSDAKDSGVSSRPEWRERLKIRPLRLKDIRGEAAVLTEIFNDAWTGNWGFVPLTVDELVSTADALKYVMPEDFGFVFELDGEPAAFGIGIPNLHEMTRDLKGRLFPYGLRLIGRIRKAEFRTARLALFGIRKKFQRSGTGGAIILALVDRMRHLYRVYRLEQIEFGWVLEDNTAMRRPIELGGAQVDKIHRVYEKQLVAPAGTTKELAASSAGGNSETLTRGLV
jgi:RimJ/RimL family protein N-acetyltransferase